MARMLPKTTLKVKIKVVDGEKAIVTIDSLTKKIEKAIQKYERLLKLQRKSIKSA